MEQLRRENKAFAQELKDLTDQLGDGGKNVHELQKARRRLECELQEAQVRTRCELSMKDSQGNFEILG